MNLSRLLGASTGIALLGSLSGVAVAAPEAAGPPQPISSPQPAAPVPVVVADPVAPQPVAEASGGEDPNATQAAVTPARPGVLTRKGTLVLEPSVEYQHTNINTFVAGGVAILDTVLIGSIEATKANRDAVTATMGFRYGITDRFEGEFRVPYMYRADSTTNTLVNTNNTQSTTDLHDSGLGDVEGAIHYQVNDGDDTWPIFVTNLRVKSTTGKGPYDVTRDAAGTETELSTGSGFWGIEPSLTMIVPSDPAVFYVNAGYLYNVPEDVDKAITATRTVRRVEPGGAVRLGMGMGLALNEKVSFTVGYQHDFIEGTTNVFNDGTFTSSTLSVGTLNLGVNWQINKQTALDIGVGIGVTSDAPDVRLMARMPIAIDLF